jgi:hypothetical protein
LVSSATQTRSIFHSRCQLSTNVRLYPPGGFLIAAPGPLRFPALSCSLSPRQKEPFHTGRERFAALRGDGLHWHNRPSSSDSRPARPVSTPPTHRHRQGRRRIASGSHLCQTSMQCRIPRRMSHGPWPATASKGDKDVPSKNRTAHEGGAPPFRIASDMIRETTVIR